MTTFVTKVIMWPRKCMGKISFRQTYNKKWSLPK